MNEVKLIITCKAGDLRETLADILGGSLGVVGVPRTKTIPEGAIINPDDVVQKDSMDRIGEPSVPPETAPEDLSRDDIKAELNNLGVEFNQKSPTKNLLAALEAARTGSIGDAPQTEPTSSEESSTSGTEASPVSKEEVRTALVALSDSKGQEIARGILSETGGVDRLSKLPEDKFVAVMDAIEIAGRK